MVIEIIVAAAFSLVLVFMIIGEYLIEKDKKDDYS